MQRYKYDENISKGWNSYPIRLTLERRLSRCCSQPLVITQSMEGGFVTANCFKCGPSRYELLSEDEFKKLPLIVCCPKCKKVVIKRGGFFGDSKIHLEKGACPYCKEQVLKHY